jgi:hypothetical protein
LAAGLAMQFDWDRIARDWERAFVDVVAKRQRSSIPQSLAS